MDCFAVLGERRRPWLDPEALKQKFLQLSAEAHPDRVIATTERQSAHDRFTKLNEAHQRLRDPKERLQHLLELETGAPPAQVQRVPAELMDLAINVGQICKQADGFLEEKAKVMSPLLQVGLFELAQEWIENIKAVRAQIEQRREEVENEVRKLDAEWVSDGRAQGAARRDLLARLEAVYRLLSYYNRWGAQLQERITRLSF